MNFLRKIAKVFSTNQRRTNSEDYTDCNEEDNIEMLSTSITRSIYGRDDTCVMSVIKWSESPSPSDSEKEINSNVLFGSSSKSIDEDDDKDNDETDNIEPLSYDSTSRSESQSAEVPRKSILRSLAMARSLESRRPIGEGSRRLTVHFDQMSLGSSLDSEDLRRVLSSVDLHTHMKKDMSERSGFSDASGFGLVETVKVPSSLESLDLIKQQVKEMGIPTASIDSEIKLREESEQSEVKIEVKSEPEPGDDKTVSVPVSKTKHGAHVKIGEIKAVKSADSLEIIRKQAEAMAKPKIRLSATSGADIQLLEDDIGMKIKTPLADMSSIEIKPSLSDEELNIRKPRWLKSKKDKLKAKKKEKGGKEKEKKIMKRSTGQMVLSEEALIDIETIEKRKAEHVEEKLRLEMQKSSEEFLRGIASESETDLTTAMDAFDRADSSRDSSMKILDFDDFFDEIFAENLGPKSVSHSSMRASAMSLGVRKSGADNLQKFLDMHLGSMGVGRVSEEGQDLAGRPSLLPEIRADKRVFQGIKRQLISMPVSLKAAEFQYRDLHRGDLLKLYRRQVDVIDYGGVFGAEDKLTGAQKLRRRVYTAVLRMFKYGLQQEAIVLEMFEFYALLFFHEINVEQLTKDFELVVELGPLIGMLVKVFTVVFVDAPLMMFMMTMAGITRYSYLKFYNSMPILRGIGYAMFALFLLNEARACVALDLGTKFLIRVAVIRSRWQSCDVTYEGESHEWRELCVPFPTNTTHNNFCPVRHARWQGTENFAMQNFLRYVYEYYNEAGSEDEAYALYAFISFGWFVIFAMAWSGFARTRKFSSHLLSIALLPVVLACVVIVMHRMQYEGIGYHKYPLEKFLIPEKTLYLIRLSTPYMQLPFLTWVCSMKPDKADPELITMSIVFFKLLWYLLVFSAAQVCIFDVIERYRLNARCFTIESIAYVYGLIPEFFSQSNFGTLVTPAWWFLMNMLVFMRAVYVLQLAIEAICQIIPVLRRFPFFVSAALCLGCITVVQLHYYKEAQLFLNDFYIYDTNSCIIVMYAIFVLGLRFLYSWTRWSDDFMFMYSRYPARVWRIWLNSAVFVSLLLIGLVFVIEVVVCRVQNIKAIFLVVAMLSVGFVMLLKHLCHFVCIHRAHASIRPTSDWRPHDPALRNYRRFYFSRRDIRRRKSRRMFTCTHHQCLNQSTLYKTVVVKQKAACDPRRAQPKVDRLNISEQRKSEFGSEPGGWQ